jgi:hypothetical protein
MDPQHSAGIGRTLSLRTQLWRLAEGLLALTLLYSLLARVVNHAYSLVAGEHLTDHEVLDGQGVLPPIVAIRVEVGTWCYDRLGPDLCNAIAGVVTCLVLGAVVGEIFEKICGNEWVKESVNIQECWEEKDWYNPVDWVTTLVCVSVEVTKWTLQWICKVKSYLVIIAVVVCIVVVLLVVFA